MTSGLYALVARAPQVPAEERSRLADVVGRSALPTSVAVVTCHRVEVYGRRDELTPLVEPEFTRRRAEAFEGHDAARHLVRLAVGLDSAIVAEDQLLHQLRTAVHQARAGSELPTDLDRLFDLALRAGRTARSWLPSRRANLAEMAIDRAANAGARLGRVLVVGSGQIGRLAAAALRDRGAALDVASRTPERARSVAALFGATPVPFDPPAASVSGVNGIVVALGGPWPLSAPARSALLDGTTWVIDLSSPPALEPELRIGLGGRLTSIDDLATADASLPSPELVARLNDLADRTLVEYAAWTAGAARRRAADALRTRAADVESAELERLWKRAPGLSAAEREEVARTLRRVTTNLLRDPLERLSGDAEGRHARAAQRLFRL